MSPDQLYSTSASLQVFDFEGIAVAFLQGQFCELGPGVMAFGIVHNHLAIQPEPIETPI